MPESGNEMAVVHERPQQNWEYAVADVHARHAPQLEDALRERGKEGWELVFVSMPYANEYQCIFKRSAL